MNPEKKYKKSLDEKWCMRFQTTHPKEEAYDGIVTHIKDDFIAIRQESDFELDGTQILPKSNIKEIRDGKYEKCCNEIIGFTGAVKKLRPLKWLASCDSIPAVIEHLMDHDIWPGIETFIRKGTETAFYLGPITEAGKSGFKLRCYDAAGKWEKRYDLDYDNIFRIEIDSKYCNNFNAFMRSKGKK